MARVGERSREQLGEKRLEPVNRCGERQGRGYARPNSIASLSFSALAQPAGLSSPIVFVVERAMQAVHHYLSLTIPHCYPCGRAEEHTAHELPGMPYWMPCIAVEYDRPSCWHRSSSI